MCEHKRCCKKEKKCCKKEKKEKKCCKKEKKCCVNNLAYACEYNGNTNCLCCYNVNPWFANGYPFAKKSYQINREY